MPWAGRGRGRGASAPPPGGRGLRRSGAFGCGSVRAPFPAFGSRQAGPLPAGSFLYLIALVTLLTQGVPVLAMRARAARGGGVAGGGKGVPPFRQTPFEDGDT